MTVDIDEPLFSLAQAVSLVPGLNAGAVQNWIARGTLAEETAARPAKNAKFKWSIRNIIILRLMNELSAFGFAPSRAVNAGRAISREADNFLSRANFKVDQRGILQHIFRRKDEMRVSCISPNGDGTFMVATYPQPFLGRASFSSSCSTYLVIEIDLIFADTINSALAAMAADDADGRVNTS